MLTNRELKKIEVDLYDIGLQELIRRRIRNSKICIIDNEFEDLKSLHDGLKKEGFTNLEKFKKSPPINDILSSHYDVILLDLNDVAQDISEEDGLGILKLLKQREPLLPILVVTGQKISPEVQPIISLADLVRKKPVYASDLANDVDTLLKSYHDKFWASLLLLKELNTIDIELKKELSFLKRLQLHLTRKSIEKKLTSREEDIIIKLEKLLKLLKSTHSISNTITKLSLNFLSND